MATFRIPILIQRNFGGTFTAQAVTGGEDYFPPVTAFAARKDTAVSEVKEYLQWLFESEPWREPTEFAELAFHEFRAEARPEYEAKIDIERDGKQSPKKRTFTVEETVPLRVACVSWKTESGNYAAVLPFLDIEFFYNRESELKNLVNLKVQETLRGLTPLALANHLPPLEIYLEEMTFQVRRKTKETETFKETPNLLAVAEPLGAKDFTKNTSKAYERETEVADLIARLTDEKTSVIITGENGIGKTTVLTAPLAVFLQENRTLKKCEITVELDENSDLKFSVGKSK